MSSRDAFASLLAATHVLSEPDPAGDARKLVFLERVPALFRAHGALGTLSAGMTPRSLECP